MKEIEELMKPRFKVIADYPDRKFPMEEVIHLKLYEGTQKPIPNTWYGIEVKGSPGIWDEAYFEKYPHLFRKLCWWEERSIEDMPEYVKYWDISMYFPVDRVCKGSEAPFKDYKFTADNFLPATLEEYQSYQSGNK